MKTSSERSRLACGLAAVFLIAACGSSARAAQWRWTRGAGWSEGTGRARATPAEQLRHAYKLERTGEYYDAAKQYFLLIRVYPDSDEAGVSLQRLAKCLFDMEDFYRSFQALEQVIETYPHTGRMADLVAIEYKIGKKLETGKYGGLLNEENPAETARRRALEVFAAVLQHDPYGSYADDALLSSGNLHLRLQEPDEAKKDFERLIKEFPRSPLVDHARLGITRADVLRGKATSSDVDRIVKEMRAKGVLQETKPEAEESESLEQSLNELEEVEAKKMWDAAHVYFRRGSHRSVKPGRFLLGELVRRYPRTSYATQARRLLPTIDVPQEGGFFRMPKIDLNPFAKKEAEEFQTPQLREEEIRSEVVIGPIPGVEDEPPGESVALAEPRAAREPRVPVPTPAQEREALRPRGEQDALSEAPELPRDLPAADVPGDETGTAEGETVPHEVAPAVDSGAGAGGWRVDLDEAPEQGRREPLQRQTATPMVPEPEESPEVGEAASPSSASRQAREARGVAGVEPVGADRPPTGADAVPSSPTRVTPRKAPPEPPAPAPKERTPETGGWKLSEEFE